MTSRTYMIQRSLTVALNNINDKAIESEGKDRRIKLRNSSVTCQEDTQAVKLFL